MTTAQAYNDFKKNVSALYNDREADTITDWIFENVTGVKKWERRRNQGDELTEIHTHLLKKYEEELLQYKPVQYVLQEAWFYKRKFYVNEDVLIPRPETEELVEWIVCDSGNNLYDIPSNKRFNLENIPVNLKLPVPHLIPPASHLQIIDIGTGSGCIAVSLKKELPQVSITAIDISGKALKVATRNAEELNAEIQFQQLNFLNESEWDQLQQYDVIVSNPPYIPDNEKESLEKNVTGFEPDIALFVPANHSFIFYEKIAKFAASHLTYGGGIYVEVHEEFAREVKVIFERHHLISDIKKDYYGKERMVRALTKKS